MSTNAIGLQHFELKLATDLHSITFIIMHNNVVFMTGAMLTRVLLMKAVDPVLYEQQIMSLLQQLQALDATRRTYYRDIRCRFLVERAIENLDKSRELQLTGQGLTMMFHLELLPLVRTLDLSDNMLTVIRGFSLLQCLETLNLSKNQLTGCQPLKHLPRLARLDLTHNSLPSVDSLSPLRSCARLQDVYLAGNPLCQEDCAADKLRELLPGVEIHVSRDLSAGDSV
ncbi:hypothetical protein BaRGS_00027044 [Batillaria attramentaria]|uniref:Uncharacterized protein n=1 Tax=Batillaria attramentaria TaxID=370345 RepID=A0ABD0K2Y6_9CAEN